jgi:hypothetical protein
VRPQRTGQSTFSFRAHEIFLRRIVRPIPRRSPPSLDAPLDRRLTISAFIVSNHSVPAKTTTTTTRCVLGPASRFRPRPTRTFFRRTKLHRPPELSRATRTPADEKHPPHARIAVHAVPAPVKDTHFRHETARALRAPTRGASRGRLPAPARGFRASTPTSSRLDFPQLRAFFPPRESGRFPSRRETLRGPFFFSARR